MANDMTLTKMATVLNTLQNQVTGKTNIAATDISSFIAQAQTTLKTGYDPVLGAISQVLSNTIFSTRPYTAKFKGLRKTNQQFGNHIRKLQTIDKDLVDSKYLDLTDGDSIDQYTVRKPEVLQTNFYGIDYFGDYLTIFDRQLDVAFTTPQELERFWSMVLGNMSDKLEQARETADRATLTNFIAAKINIGGDGVVHLVTEYNAAMGTKLTSATVLYPDNFKPFIQWAYARIQYLCSMLTERTEMYHLNITGKAIKRHTPYNRMKAYMYTPLQYRTKTSIFTDAFNEGYYKLIDHEDVNFWQSAKTPGSIKVTPSYIGADGALAVAPEAVSNDNVFGVIFDEEAIGITEVGRSVKRTPYNAAGEYSNIWYRLNQRYWNDVTENGIVLLLD